MNGIQLKLRQTSKSMEFISRMPLQRWKTTSRLQCAILSQKTKTGGSLSGRMLLAVYSLWFTRGEKIMPA